MTLPQDWSKRRLRVPEGVLLYYGDIKKDAWVDIGAIPVTNVRRTLIDCIDAHVSFEHIDAALRQATARKLLDKRDAKAIRAHSSDQPVRERVERIVEPHRVRLGAWRRQRVVVRREGVWRSRGGRACEDRPTGRHQAAMARCLLDAFGRRDARRPPRLPSARSHALIQPSARHR